jgi:hypothetical protein
VGLAVEAAVEAVVAAQMEQPEQPERLVLRLPEGLPL